jgi:hypothetical protein
VIVLSTYVLNLCNDFCLFACFGHRSKKKGRSMLNWDLICLTTVPYRDLLGARFGQWFFIVALVVVRVVARVHVLQLHSYQCSQGKSNC